MGAEYVCGIEIDADAIDIAVENCTEFFDDEDDDRCPIDFINAELVFSSGNSGDDEEDQDTLVDCCDRFNSSFDVVSPKKSSFKYTHAN